MRVEVLDKGQTGFPFPKIMSCQKENSKEIAVIQPTISPQKHKRQRNSFLKVSSRLARGTSKETLVMVPIMQPEVLHRGLIEFPFPRTM